MNAHQRRIALRLARREVEKANAISMAFFNGMHEACARPYDFSVFYDQNEKGEFQANIYFGDYPPMAVPIHIVLDSK